MIGWVVMDVAGVGLGEEMDYGHEGSSKVGVAGLVGVTLLLLHLQYSTSWPPSIYSLHKLSEFGSCNVIVLKRQQQAAWAGLGCSIKIRGGRSFILTEGCQ